MFVPSLSSIFGSDHKVRFFPKVSLGRLMSLEALYRQRRDLQTLEAHMLDDIGVTQAEADQEAARPVWDVPSYWR